MKYSAFNEHQVGYILTVMNIESNGEYKISGNCKICVVQIGVPHCITDLWSFTNSFILLLFDVLRLFK